MQGKPVSISEEVSFPPATPEYVFFNNSIAIILFKIVYVIIRELSLYSQHFVQFYHLQAGISVHKCISVCLTLTVIMLYRAG